MALKLRNRWHYKENDWWDWEVFLDDSGSGELSNVAYVEYVLHPTFLNPVRKISDSKGGFVLKTSGWGIFMLKAFVHTKDRRKIKLKHELELHIVPKQGITK